MSAIISWIVGKIGYDVFKKGFFITLAGVYYSVVISFYLFLGSLLIKVYNLVTSLLNYISSTASTAASGGDSYLHMFFSLLNCSGIISAVNDSKSLFFSALGFYFARIAYSYMLMLKAQIFKIGYRVLRV